jgi:hypothetical protein
VTPTPETAFAQDLVRSIADTVWAPDNETDAERERRYEAAFTSFSAFNARGAAEQMLAAQAAVAHNAAMACLKQAMNPSLPPKDAARMRTTTAMMARMSRDTLKALTALQRPVAPKKKPEPVFEQEAEASFELIDPHADLDTPRPVDFRVKIPNGDPARDFLSRRFGPDEDMEAAWQEASRQSAALEAEGRSPGQIR